MASETFTFYVQPWYRKSPYFEATKRHGCKSWGLYNHMLLPTLYDDPVTEYRALLKDVTLWDVAVERCVEVRGPDAFDLVNLVTCRDLTKVETMQARYVLLTAPWGAVVPGNLVAARLHEQRGELAAALAAVRRRIFGLEPFPETLTNLREEGRLAALTGDRVGAARAYRHYLAIRIDPEPVLRAQVAQVHADLAALEQGTERGVSPSSADTGRTEQ